MQTQVGLPPMGVFQLQPHHGLPLATVPLNHRYLPDIGPLTGFWSYLVKLCWFDTPTPASLCGLHEALLRPLHSELTAE